MVATRSSHDCRAHRRWVARGSRCRRCVGFRLAHRGASAGGSGAFGSLRFSLGARAVAVAAALDGPFGLRHARPDIRASGSVRVVRSAARVGVVDLRAVRGHLLVVVGVDDRWDHAESRTRAVGVLDAHARVRRASWSGAAADCLCRRGRRPDAARTGDRLHPDRVRRVLQARSGNHETRRSDRCATDWSWPTFE